MKWMSNGIPEDICRNEFKRTIYCIGIRQGNKADWTRLWKKYSEISDKKEKKVILAALGCSKDETILKAFFKFYAILTFPKTCIYRGQN